MDELSLYKDITADIPKEDIILISQITRRFINDKIAKSKQYRSKNIRSEMRKSMLKGKEFIHYSGFWNQYIEYLKKELNK